MSHFSTTSQRREQNAQGSAQRTIRDVSSSPVANGHECLGKVAVGHFRGLFVLLRHVHQLLLHFNSNHVPMLPCQVYYQL